MGWRYTWYTLGTMVLIMSLLRLIVIKFDESPKWLLIQNRDADAIMSLYSISRKANRTCKLTLEQLEACGTVNLGAGRTQPRLRNLVANICGLFSCKTLGLSTSLLFLSFAFVGLAFPLFNVFYHNTLNHEALQLVIVV